MEIERMLEPELPGHVWQRRKYNIPHTAAITVKPYGSIV
jgi:hypothetical protein